MQGEKRGFLQAILKGKERVRSIRWLNWCVAFMVVFIFPLLYQMGIEYMRSRSVGFTLEYVWLRRAALLPGYVVLVALFLLFTIISARPWVANLVMGGVLWLLGYTNYYKLVYRGEPVLPKDLVQAADAARISSELEVPFTREIWLVLLFWLLTTLGLLFFRIRILAGWKRTAVVATASVLLMAFIPYSIFGYMNDKVRMSVRHGVSLRQLSMAETYYQNTFVTSFLFLASNMWQQSPEGYSQKEMQALLQEMPQQKAAKQTDVILVLMESFYDIASIEGTAYAEELMPNYTRLSQEGIAGNMLSEKRGGGTSNIEFNVLTGFADNLFPQGSVPFIEYMKADFPSLPNYYAGLGYRTVAVHPYIEGFYKRDTAYKAMNIQEFYSVDDFSEEDYKGMYVSDDTFADKIIEEYEKSAAADEHIFINGVSMQNHVPYTEDFYQEKDRVAAISGQGAGFDAALTTAATGIRDMDSMMGKLTDYFRESERDVVILFYGDHQTAINDQNETDLVTLTDAYQKMDEEQKWQATHTTPYLMWANFTLEGAGEKGEVLAPYLLFPRLLRAASVDAPDWFYWLGRTSEDFGGFVNGYAIRPDGEITLEIDENQREQMRKMQLLQYDAMFGRGYAAGAFYSDIE